MNAKRLWQTLVLNTKRGASGRGDYLRGICAMVGEHVAFQPRVVPLYPELIKLHNNIMIASNVKFVTHDAIHYVLNYGRQGAPLPEYVGCIEVMDNVFIGSGSTVLYGVRIGGNVIVGSGSLVNTDLEPNGVYAGVPARRIGDFQQFLAGRESMDYSSVKRNQNISAGEIAAAWACFEQKHSAGI